MAVTANSAITPQKIKSAQIQVTLASSSLGTTAPTNLVKLMNPSADGGRLTKLELAVHDSTVATKVLVYKSKDGGTTKHLWKTKVIPAFTSSNILEAPTYDLGLDDSVPDFMGTTTDEIYVGLVTACAGINVFAQWGDYS